MSAREIPILFSAAMARAILAGLKTQTRRILKPQPRGQPWYWAGDEIDPVAQWFDGWEEGRSACGAPEREVNVPLAGLRWRVGDRLWVKETFRGAAGYDHQPPRDWGNKPIWYCADGEPPASGSWWFLSNRARSPLHMPRWASRIDLLVTDVCVQRLQEISEEDAMAEGMIWDPPTAEDAEWWSAYCAEHGEDPADRPMEGVWLAPGTRQGFGGTKEQRARPQFGCTAKQAYRWVWDAINGAGSWDANPWVAAITFERIRP